MEMGRIAKSTLCVRLQKLVIIAGFKRNII